MNIFICDDDNLVCEQIKTLCESYYIEHKLKRPDIYIFHSGEDILASDIKPDIVYLDIQMSGIDGIAVGNSLVKSYPAAIIIIITSFPEYLDEAMRFHVFRYISKPVESKRFMRNLEDAISEFNSIGGRIIVKCKGTTYILSAKDIIMVGVNPHRRNLTIYTVSGVKPGKKTADYLDSIMSRITLPGSIFLAIVAILPAFAQICGVSVEFSQFFGGTSLLILVGVVLDPE